MYTVLVRTYWKPQDLCSEPCGDLNGQEIQKEREWVYTYTHTYG